MKIILLTMLMLITPKQHKKFKCLVTYQQYDNGMTWCVESLQGTTYTHQYSTTKIKKLLTKYDLTAEEINILTYIALCESNGFINTIGDNGNSFGLFQLKFNNWAINGFPPYPPKFPQFANKNPFDPEVNAQLAIEIYKHSGRTSWSCK